MPFKSPIQFEFPRKISQLTIPDDLSPTPFSVEIYINPELLARKFYAGWLDSRDTSDPVYPATPVAKIASQIEWYEGETLVGSEPANYYGNDALTPGGIGDSCPLRVSKRSLAGECSDMAADCWVITDNSRQVGTTQLPQTVILYPQHRKIRAARIVWSGTVNGSALQFGGIWFMLGCYSENP